MKFYSRLLLICIWICCSCKTAEAQLDYSVYNFEEIHRILQNDKWPDVLLKGFEPVEDYDKDGDLLFKNASGEKIYISSTGDDITKLKFVTQRIKVQRIANSLSADKRYTNTSDHIEKINGQEHINRRFTYGKCVYMTSESYNTFELYVPSGASLPPAPGKTVTTPAPIPTKPRFTTAASFAAYLNRNMEGAEILRDFSTEAVKPTSYKNEDYEFALLGKTDHIKSSFEFFAKEDKLYMRMFFPQAGDCRSGLVEIEAKQGRVKGWGSEVFSIKSLNYKRVCGGKLFNTISVFIYHHGDDNLSKQVNDWLEENTL